MKELYKKLQDAFLKEAGIKEGDTVKVVAKAETRQMGWGNSWNEDTMDQMVGKEFTLERLRATEAGILLEDYWFPFFVLEKVERKYPDNIDIGGGYKVEFKDKGTIKAGCRTISFPLLEEIYLAAKKVKENS